MKTLVLSLGGSLIVPDKIDVLFLKQFKLLIDKFVKKGYRFVIVTGGGKTCRRYQKAMTDVIGKDDLGADWLGISATHMNAQLVKSLFSDVYPEVIINPTQKINFKEKILIAGGWKPGFSSDMDAVLLAKNIGAKKVINLSNIKYAYDKDPNKFKNAKKFESLSWNEFRTLVGNKWDPGLNTPFDPVASKEAQKNKLAVVIADGKDIKNLEKIFLGEKFKGTIIL